MKPDHTEVACRRLGRTDYPAAKEIIAASFSQAVQANPLALEVLEQELWYDPAHLMVAEVGGRVVSFLGVRTGRLTCSEQRIPAGLVGTVCTVPEMRGQGIGARLMGASFEQMKRDDLFVSYLHTSEERFAFYARLGYRKATMENPRLALSLEDIPLAVEQKTADVRSATPTDAGACNRIYEEFYGRINGSWSRTEPFWARRLEGQPKLFGPVETSFRLSGRECPEAYVALRESADTGTVSEWACLHGKEDVAFDLLRSVLRDWRNRGIATAQLEISTCHPLRNLVEEFVSENQTGYSPVLVRVQNCDSFLKQIRSTLDVRATSAELRVEIRICGGGQVFEVGAGKPLRMAIDVGDLCSLFYNGRRLPGLLKEGGIDIDPDQQTSLNLLFPDTGATRCAIDAY